jgi:hypothetical protein
LQLFVFAYDLDKHQTVYNTYGRNKCICKQICIQIYIYIYIYVCVCVCVILWLSLNLEVYCFLETSGVLWGLLLIQ